LTKAQKQIPCGNDSQKNNGNDDAGLVDGFRGAEVLFEGDEAFGS
jgi:hypothetical protein